ncbi:TetR/AcrR family transcriptional regulator [Spirillospora sp. NPDC050679]
MNGDSGRDRILRAALTCFGRDGAAATTLTALRKEAGVSVGSFYHHFQSKEEVVAALFAEALRGYQDEIVQELDRHPDPGEAVPAVVARHVGWCVRNPDLARFLLTERRPVDGEPGMAALTEQNRRFFGAVRSWWRIQEHHGALRPLDFTLAFVLWLGPAQELCRLWVTGVAPEPSAEQVALLGDAARRSLCPAR